MRAREGWPHGYCECRLGCQCEREAGPVVWTVLRDGKPLRVCTRCYLSGDTEKRMVVTRDDPAQHLCDWDALGAFVVMGRLMLDEPEES